MEKQRYQASSRIVHSVDQIGFIYLDRDREENGFCNLTNTFEPCSCHGMSVQLAKIPTSWIRNDSCFSFQNDSICVPASVFDEEKANCTTLVASFINFENGTGLILLSSCLLILLSSYPPQAYSLPSLFLAQTSLTSLDSPSTMGRGLKSKTKRRVVAIRIFT